jgi:glycosyltransferase involved in cell wall biosynthesis
VSAAIWHLIDSSSVGGAERHVAQVVQALSERGIRAEAVLYRDYGNNAWLRQLAQAGVPHRVLGGSFAALMRSVAQDRPAILHTHGYKAGILGRPAALLNGIPLVSTFHTGERSRGKLLLYELADEWTSFAGARVAVSKPIQSRLPYRSTLIDNFVRVDSKPLPPALPRRAAFVGRLRPEKGPELFCALSRSNPDDIEWHVYGDGPLRTNLEREFGNTVRFHGVVADMSAVWDSIGLLVMPSIFEGLPLAALEALAAGVPILATRVGALPDVVIEGQTGWLFDVRDLAKAHLAIQEWSALRADQQAEMRQACRRHVQQRFSESVQIGKLLDVYRKAGLTMSPSSAAISDPASSANFPG